MIKYRYHLDMPGIILGDEIFENESVPLIDLRNINLPSAGTYNLPLSEHIFTKNKGYFDFDKDKKEYFFKTEEGRVLSFKDSEILTKALAGDLLKIEGLENIVLEKDCLNELLNYENESMPGADWNYVDSLKRRIKHYYKGIINLD